jgi:uncharacterized membrane protein
MNVIDLFLLGHVLGTTILVGGAFTLQVLAALASRSPTAADLAALSRQAAWFGPRVFLPAGVLIAATGVELATREGYDFAQPFVVLGLIALAAAAATGPAYLAPESSRVSRLLAAEGAACAEARVRLRRLFLVSRMELAVLVIAMAGMVLKPVF